MVGDAWQRAENPQSTGSRTALSSGYGRSADQHDDALSRLRVRARPQPQGWKQGDQSGPPAKDGSENAFGCRGQTEIKGLAGDGVWKSASSENFRLRGRVSGRRWPTLTGESLRFGQRSGGLSTPPPRRTSLWVHCCRDQRLRMLNRWRNFDIFTDAPERLTHAGD